MPVNPTLPTPGADDGTWGDELNTALGVIVAGVNAEETARAAADAALDARVDVLEAAPSGTSGLDQTAADARYVTRFNGGREQVRTLTAASGSVQVNVDDGNVHDLTLTGNATLSFAGAEAGAAVTFTLVLRQDATGSRTVAWPGSVTWADGLAPLLSTTGGSVDVVSFLTLDGGATWLGFGGRAAAAAAGNLDGLTDVTITTPTNGQVLKYNGTQWVNGTDETAAAGAGISASIVDAKGDLIAGTANDTVARLPVGTDGQVLTASSAATTGLAWAPAPSGSGGGTLAVDRLASAATQQTDSTGPAADVTDGTDSLAVSFTVPGSGGVWVELGASFSVGASTTCEVALRRTGDNTVMGQQFVSNGGIPGALRLSLLYYISGLTPGATETWKVSIIRTAGTSTCRIFHNNTNNPAVIRVAAA